MCIINIDNITTFNNEVNSMPAPNTRSAGKLVLIYTAANLTHRAGVNYITGVDLNDVATIRTEAGLLGDTFKTCLRVGQSILGWEIKSAAGVHLYGEQFAVAKAGTLGLGFNMKDYLSWSITVPGLGVPTDIANGSGRTLFRYFPLGSHLIEPGQKIMAQANIPAGLTALASLFHTNLRYYADFYGQKADPTGLFPVQMNAAVQRRYGS